MSVFSKRVGRVVTAACRSILKNHRHYRLPVMLILIGTASISLSADPLPPEAKYPTLDPPRITGLEHGPVVPRRKLEPRIPSMEWIYHKTADSAHPDDQEQAMMWLMNRARQDPTAEGIWLATSTEWEVSVGRTYWGVDLAVLQNEFTAIAPKPPAAFDRRLYEAALLHSWDLIFRDAQDHAWQVQRVIDCGFSFSAFRGNAYSYAINALHAHAAYNIDWGPGTPDGMQSRRGHRRAIMSIDGDYTNVGLAMVPDNNPATRVGPWVNTGNFAQAYTGASDHYNVFIVGTVWEDRNDNERYDPGEGIGGIEVTPDQGTYYAVTSAGGGYAIPVTMSAGEVSVHFSGPGIDRVRNITVNGTHSVLLDLETSDLPVTLLAIDYYVPDSRFSGRVLLFEGSTGVFIEKFIASCASGGDYDCASAPGAAETPIDLTFGPDGRLYLGDRPVGGFGYTQTGIAVKRYRGATGEYDPFDDPDPYAAFVRYGEGGLDQLGGIAFGPDGNLYVSNLDNFGNLPGNILRYDGQTGDFIDAFVPAGSSPLQEPGCLLFGPENTLYVCDWQNDAVYRYEGPLGGVPGSFLGEFVNPGTGGLDRPSGLDFGPDGNLYVVSHGTHSVLRFTGPADTLPGTLIDQFIPTGLGGLTLPRSLKFGPDGDLYVSNATHVLRYDGNAGAYKGVLAFVRDPGAFVFSTIPDVPDDLGDFNGDSCVDRADLSVILFEVRAGGGDPTYDLNGDGLVNIADARKLVLLFANPNGTPCP